MNFLVNISLLIQSVIWSLKLFSMISLVKIEYKEKYHANDKVIIAGGGIGGLTLA